MEKAKKGRAKKTPPIVASVSPTGIVGNFLGEQRPLIVHLPIRPDEITFDKTPSMMTYDPSVPEVPIPYEEGRTEYAMLETKTDPISTTLSIESTVESNSSKIVKARTPSHYSEKLMIQYQESNRLQQLPQKSFPWINWLPPLAKGLLRIILR